MDARDFFFVYDAVDNFPSAMAKDQLPLKNAETSLRFEEAMQHSNLFCFTVKWLAVESALWCVWKEEDPDILYMMCTDASYYPN